VASDPLAERSRGHFERDVLRCQVSILVCTGMRTCGIRRPFHLFLFPFRPLSSSAFFDAVASRKMMMTNL
jgi:hypothetical protein